MYREMDGDSELVLIGRYIESVREERGFMEMKYIYFCNCSHTF
jgi:hypothetical protein